MAHYETGDRLAVEPGDEAASKALPGKPQDLAATPTRPFSKTASILLLLLSYLIFQAPELSMPFALAAIFFGYRVSVRLGATVGALNLLSWSPRSASSAECSSTFAARRGFRDTAIRARTLAISILSCAATAASGCVVTGSEPFTQSPYNLALRILIKTFGPMRGVYSGPYPTSEEAFALIRQSSRRVTYEGLAEEVRHHGLNNKVDIHTPLGRATPLSNKHAGYAVALYKESALIVGSEYGVCLIARDSGQRFATMDFENLQAFRDWHEGSWSK